MGAVLSAAGKARGAKFETDLLKRIREAYRFPAERLRLAGKNDEGDLALVHAPRFIHVVIEAKAERPHDFASAVREMLVERDNYAKARGIDPRDVLAVSVHKRPGKSIGESYVVTTLDEFFGN